MARMIPNRIRLDTKSRAERKLYEVFQRALPDRFTVLHSIAWQAPNPRSGARDGEADFVLMHPELGILVLEVKGGLVQKDPYSHEWFSNYFEIQNPFDQVRRNKYSLRDLLKEQPYWKQRSCTIGHAVAFPDGVVQSHWLGPEAPRAIVLDQTDLARIEDWVIEAFQHYRGADDDSAPLGDIGVAELVKLLSPSVTVRPLLGYVIQDETHELVRLTEQQFRLLDFLSRHRRVAISGCAGSGKTLLAAEKSRRLAQQGYRVLLTCFNRKLAEFLAASLVDEPKIHVAHFHGLCRQIAEQAGRWPGEPSTDPDTFFGKVLPDLLVDCAHDLGWNVDAVIVDEAQDFQEEWWLALQLLLADPKHGVFYAFYDDNQKIYGRRGQLPLETAPHTLTENCRNTQTIHRFVQPYYRGEDPVRAIGPAGRTVDVYRYSSEADLKSLLRKQLHQLANVEQVPTEDIVILTPRAVAKSALSRFGTLGNFRLVTEPGESGEVLYTTIHQFKGLESPVVILAEIEPEVSRNLDMLLYVGASRARNHLVVLAHEDVALALDQAGDNSSE